MKPSPSNFGGNSLKKGFEVNNIKPVKAEAIKPCTDKTIDFIFKGIFFPIIDKARLYRDKTKIQSIKEPS